MSGEASDTRASSSRATTPTGATSAVKSVASAADSSSSVTSASADAGSAVVSAAAASDSSESGTSVIDGIEIDCSLCEPGRLPHREMETFHLDEQVEDDGTQTVQSFDGSGWTNCDAQTFEVRVGPSYVSGQKTPSEKSLYDVFAVDGFYTPLKVNAFYKYTTIKRHSSEHMLRLPQEMDADGSLSTHLQQLLPPVVMINFMIPYYEPEMSTGRSNGEGYSVLLYAKMSDETKSKLTDWAKEYFVPWASSVSSSSSEEKKSEEQQYPNPRDCPNWDKLTPAIRLLSNFIRARPGDDLRKRFKVIARAMNLAYSGLSFLTRQMVYQYNAKPFLARTSSTFYDESPQLFAVDIDSHLFGYPARRGLAHFRDIVENVIYDIAFVIEGCEDDELPECILLCARIARLGKDKAARFPLPFLKHAYRSDPGALKDLKEPPIATAAARRESGVASASAPVLPSTAASSASDPESGVSPKSGSATRLWGLFG